ncbi:MAG: choice-of-anchor D domain-containing protein [Bacteroidota bacterium]|nr:choice-of-anchor D domain-containing protein [Bacteroidota bacterium]
MKKLFTFFILLCTSALVQASDIYSIGTGNVPGEVAHYASLKAACDSLNAHTAEITTDRIYYITSDLTEPVNVNVFGNTNGAIVTFKPYTGITPTITFTQTTDNTGLSGGFIFGVKNLTTTSGSNYGITLNDSTQNFVIDGSNTNGGTTRDLTIKTNTGISGNTNPIRIFGNTNKITIKNTVVVTGQSVSYAILITVRQTAAVGYAGTYVPDSIMVDNCDVTNTFGSAGQGIAISNSGAPSAFPTGVVFSNNKVTAKTRGIFLNNAGNTDVFGNEISVTQTTAGNLSEGIYAFAIGSSTNVTNIFNNKIIVLSTANTTAGSYGIEGIQIGTQGIYNIYNNIITGFVFPDLAQGIFVGIGVATATTNGITANIYYNSIFMANGSNTAGATPPIQAAFYMKLNGASGTRAVNLKNNIFANLESDYATQAIYVDTTNAPTLVSNYNNLYSAGGSGKVGKFGVTDCATLADWKTASSQDANSVSDVPGFVSESNLHIVPTMYPVSVVSDAGTPIAEITKDIDGDLRNATTPDIGADEYVATPVIPTAGFSASPASMAFGKVWKDSTKTDSVTVSNTGSSASLKIDSVKSDNPLFTVSPTNATIAISGELKFAVSFAPVAKGPQSAKIYFYHNAPNKLDSITISGTGIIKEAIFSATPLTLTFTGILVGQSKKDSITVTNIGTDSLKITGVTSSNGVFTVTPTSANLDTNASAKFYVTYTPLVSGTQLDTIIFTSNSAEVHDTITASGTSIAQSSIKAARNTANGTTVFIEGVITRAKGSYIYMQDTSAAIIVYSGSTGWLHDSLATGYFVKGDKIQVVGATSEFRSLKEIATTGIVSVTRMSRSNTLPVAQLITLKEIAANGEDYEAELIKVINLSVTGSGAYAAATSYPVTDPTDSTNTVVLRTPNAADGDVDGMNIINKVTFTGVLGQFTTTTGGYQLMAMDSTDVTDNSLGVHDPYSGIPTEYQLQNNYPNPFNPSTTILYGIPQASRVSITIYSILGQEVKTLVNDIQNASYYRVVWNGTNNNGTHVASGVYFFRLRAESITGDGKQFVQLKKMSLLK